VISANTGAMDQTERGSLRHARGSAMVAVAVAMSVAVAMAMAMVMAHEN
jgi:hypothetical protein